MASVVPAGTKADEFREALAAAPLTSDGAMGTMLATTLASRGAFAGRCLEELNLSLAALVRDVHRDYLRAGAQILRTNTFGANRLRLDRFGFGAKTRAINQAAVRIAQEAVRGAQAEGVFIAGVVGPLGVPIEPLGNVSRAAARGHFEEQIRALLESGVDLLIFQTFQDLAELEEAVAAARETCGEELPVIAEVSVEEDGSLACGASIEELSRRLEALPVDVIGLNCSSGPGAILETLERMASLVSKPLSVSPNAGLPSFQNGIAVYPCSPGYLAGIAEDFLRAGARILGGCCGTTPEHIRRLRAAVAAVKDPVERPAAQAVEARNPAVPEPVDVSSRSKLGAALAARDFVQIVEVPAPRGPNPERELGEVRRLQQAGIRFVAISEASHSPRWEASAAGHVLQQDTGAECILAVHGTSPRRLQSELLGAHALGLRNLICPAAHRACVAIASSLNRGLDLGGNSLGSQTSFLGGVSVNPCAADVEAEIRQLEAAVDAGADFLIAQPVFDLDGMEEFLKRIEGFRLPVIVRVRLIAGLRDADFLLNELRTPLPVAYLNRLGQAEDPEAEGRAILGEMIQRLRSMVSGIYGTARALEAGATL